MRTLWPAYALALLLFAFGLFVYPTPWAYYKAEGPFLVRVTRFTGYVDLVQACLPSSHAACDFKNRTN